MSFRSLIILILTVILFDTAFAEDDLVLTEDDLILKEGTEGGFHLWIRKKPGIGSVLLTESTVDPQKKLNIYALRTLTYNPVNGDEKRLLNGQFLTSNVGIVDSTPEPHEIFTEAFHLFIPYVVTYGYPGGRNGEIQVTAGTFLNIKTFSLPYADWSGKTMDNPFLVSILSEEEQKVVPEGEYKAETLSEFVEIAEEGNGESVSSSDNEDIIPSINKSTPGASGEAWVTFTYVVATLISTKLSLPVFL